VTYFRGAIFCAVGVGIEFAVCAAASPAQGAELVERSGSPEEGVNYGPRAFRGLRGIYLHSGQGFRGSERGIYEYIYVVTNLRSTEGFLLQGRATGNPLLQGPRLEPLDGGSS